MMITVCFVRLLNFKMKLYGSVEIRVEEGLRSRVWSLRHCIGE